MGHGSRRQRALYVYEPENIATRALAFAYVRDLLRQLVQASRRVLVGFDFPYGYPRGFAEALRLPPDPHGPWHAVWRVLAERIQDDQRNGNNRFAVASELNAMCADGSDWFWGCPPKGRTEHLSPTRRPAKARWRTVEWVLRDLGKQPQETFKLLGAGSVGSQTLSGIPYVFRLRHDEALAPCSLVWPFEEGSRVTEPREGPLVLHAEIWPGAVKQDPTLHPIRDAAQVMSLTRWAARMDAAGKLATYLACPLERAGTDQERILREEGWILGVAPA